MDYRGKELGEIENRREGVCELIIPHQLTIMRAPTLSLP